MVVQLWNLREQKDPFLNSSQLASVLLCSSSTIKRDSQVDKAWVPGCAHFFDIWHIARSIGKAMIRSSKKKVVRK